MITKYIFLLSFKLVSRNVKNAPTKDKRNHPRYSSEDM